MFKAIQTTCLIGAASAVRLHTLASTDAARIDIGTAFAAAAAGTYTKKEAAALLVQTLGDLESDAEGVLTFLKANATPDKVKAVLDGVALATDPITAADLGTALQAVCCKHKITAAKAQAAGASIEANLTAAEKTAVEGYWSQAGTAFGISDADF